MTKSISVIGSAGRRGDGDKLNRLLYDKCFEQLCEELNKEDLFYLKSGGAAFCDHLAIRYFLEFPKKVHKLILFFPCFFDFKKAEFYGHKDASIANYYHNQFYIKTGINSLGQIAVLNNNPNVIINAENKGFFERNIWVGKSDKIIAFTFSATGAPKDGGTSHTWNHSSAKEKIHFDIGKYV